MAEEIELGGEGFLDSPEGTKGLLAAVGGPGLHTGPGSGCGSGRGLDRSIEGAEPVGEGEVVIVEKTDIVAAGRVEADVERSAASAVGNPDHLER